MDDVRTVLLVDDDDDIRTIGTIGLERVGGLDVRSASSGRDGVEAARGERPDVILLDMMMPDLDGMATLELLRADPMTSDIPVIFMTAKVQGNEVGEYLAAGAVGVIAKPFDPLGIAQEVRSIIAAEADRHS